MIKYENLLRGYSLKVTPQRVAIVEDLYKNGHMSIDELYKSVKERFSTISLATIYKNINSMIDVSFVKEIKIPNQKSKYELTKKSHSHIICQKCGKVEDITLNLDDLISKASKESNYTITENSVVLSGICGDCQ